MATAKARIGGAWVDTPLTGAARVGGARVPFGPGGTPATPQSLFVDADLAGANLDFLETGGGPLTLGTVISPTVNGQVTKGRWRFPGTSTGAAIKFVLYNVSTTARLSEAVFSSPTWGAWNEVALPAPVSVTAGQNLLACIYQSTTNVRYPAEPAFFNVQVVRGNLIGVATSTVTNGRFGAGDAFPTGNFNASCYFPDLVFVAS